MIITRTPFRVTLGGGGTDMASYYSQHGGFIFSFALDKYMYISLNRPVADELIRVKYMESETVANTCDIKHEIARACLERHSIKNSIEITSTADIPGGSGLGSSSCYTVGLLNAIRALKRDYISIQDLAEEACDIEINVLQKPIGKQDQYLAAFGGLTIMEISKNGNVKTSSAEIPQSVVQDLKNNLLIFYTGVERENKKILGMQNQSILKSDKDVMDSLHYIKESGYKILELVRTGNITDLGLMFDEHWRRKKKLAKGISNPRFDEIYDTAISSGALGGKISGAGGGGFFLFYCEEKKSQLRSAMAKLGLKEIVFDFDFCGSKLLGDFIDRTN